MDTSHLLRRSMIDFLVDQGYTREYAEELNTEDIAHPYPKVWCEECIINNPRIRRIVLQNDIHLTK